MSNEATGPYDLAGAWRRSMDANIRYYRAWAGLAQTWMNDVMEATTGLRGSVDSPVLRAMDRLVEWTRAQSGAPQAQHQGPHRERAAAAAPAPPATTASGNGAQPSAAIVLEGQAGEEVVGVFVVHNQFANRVEAPVVAEPFLNATGQSADVVFHLDPEAVSLAQGEQVVVRMRAVVPPSIEPGARYQSRLTVPGLTGTQLPIVLYRREAAKEDRPAAQGAGGQPRPKLASAPRPKPTTAPRSKPAGGTGPKPAGRSRAKPTS
jgi:hypothetical protein